MATSGGVPEHGTEARYRRGCRCQRCKKAARDARAQRRAARDAREAVDTGRDVAQLHAGGPTERRTRIAVGQIDKLDVWKAPLAEAAIAAAKKIDDGTATAPLFVQLRDLLEIVNSEESRGTGLAGLAALGSTRG